MPEQIKRPIPKKLQMRADGKVVPIKFGDFGETGSGKSYTAACLAAGLSVEMHNCAPAYVYDTEPGWQFLKKIFDVEGIKLIQEPGDSFDGLRAARKKAEEMGCCVFVGDSYTHVWRELMHTYTNRAGYVEFQDWNLIKPRWRDWVREFLNSPMHCMALGRLGWNYIPEEVERNGKTKTNMVKSDSKFNAGGGESFGYEPHLLVEMEIAREETDTGRGGQIVHLATVLKDRADVINGDTFTFKELRGYKKGDYAYVWNAFFPHIQEMQNIESHVLLPTTRSAQPESDNSYQQRQRDRTVALGEIKETMMLLWPGKTDDNKILRAKISEKVFGVRSWDAVQEAQLGTLQAGLEVLRRYESMVDPKDPLTTEKSVLEAIDHSKNILAEETLQIQDKEILSTGEPVPF